MCSISFKEEEWGKKGKREKREGETNFLMSYYWELIWGFMKIENKI